MWQFLKLFLLKFWASQLSLMIKPMADLQFDKLSFNPKVQSKSGVSIQGITQGLEKIMH